MAKCKFGMMMTDARGKLGGQVFTKNRSGAVIRTKVTPTNPKTDAQAAARSALGIASANWSNLTELQRSAWNSVASTTSKKNIFGDNYFPSGKNMFVGVNANLQSAELAGLDAPGTDLGPGGILSIKLQLNKTAGTFQVLPDLVIADPNAVLIFLATAPKSAGTYNFSGKYVQFALTPVSETLTNVQIYQFYIGRFGVPPIGSKISFSLHLISTAGYKSVTAQSADIVI